MLWCVLGLLLFFFQGNEGRAGGDASPSGPAAAAATSAPAGPASSTLGPMWGTSQSLTSDQLASVTQAPGCQTSPGQLLLSAATTGLLAQMQATGNGFPGAIPSANGTSSVSGSSMLLSLGCAGAGTSLSQTCPGSPTPPNVNSIVSAGMMSQGGGGMMGMMSVDPCSMITPQATALLNQEIKISMCANICLEMKVQAIQSSVLCVQGMMAQLNVAAAGLANEVKQRQADATAQLLKYTQQIDNLNKQQDSVNTYLNDPNTGLLAQQTKIQATIQAIPATISTFTQRAATLTQTEAQLPSQLNAVKMGLITQCMTQTPSQPSCDPNNPGLISVTAALVCKIQFGGSTNAGGQYSTNSTTLRNANNNATQASDDLTKLFGQSPTAIDTATPPVPTTADQPNPVSTDSLASFQGRITDPNTLLSQAAFLQQYGVYGDFQAQLQYCEGVAQQGVQQLQSNPNSNYNQTKTQLGIQQSQFNQDAQTAFSDWSNQYQTLSQSLNPGQGAAPLSLATTCTTGSPGQIVSCMQDVQNTLNNTLSGGSGVQASSFVLVGNTGGQPTSVTCTGVNSCIAALNNQNKSLSSTVALNQALKAQYSNQNFTSAQSYFKSLADAMTPVASAFQQVTNNLLSAASGLGQAMPTIASPTSKGTITMDPNTGVASLGGVSPMTYLMSNTSPPIPDTSSIAAAANSVSATGQQASNNLAELGADAAQIQSLETYCNKPKETSKEEGDGIDRTNLQMQVNGVTPPVHHCIGTSLCDTNGSVSTAVMQVQSQFKTHGSALSIQTASLTSGINQKCDPELTSGLTLKDNHKTNCNNYLASLVELGSTLEQANNQRSTRRADSAR